MRAARVAGSDAARDSIPGWLQMPADRAARQIVRAVARRPLDDALVADVIGAYRKQLQKGLAEYEKAGERGASQVGCRKISVSPLMSRMLNCRPP